jgi:plasmid stability protein
MARARTTDLQIRGIPNELRERLRRRASGKGVSMSQYVIEKLETDLATPTIDEWLDEVAKLPKVDPRKLGTSGAELVREGREERLRQILGPERSSTRRRRSRS